jgi:hypothetical protein
MDTDGAGSASKLVVFVIAHHTMLREALVQLIEQRGGYAVISHWPLWPAFKPAAVVAPTSDLSPLECAALRRAGMAPIVLAACPNAVERERYEDGHAVYLAMDVTSSASLFAALREVEASDETHHADCSTS